MLIIDGIAGESGREPWREQNVAGSLRDAQHVVVGGDAPDLAAVVPVDRRVRPHPGEARMRVVGVPGAVEESDGAPGMRVPRT